MDCPNLPLLGVTAAGVETLLPLLLRYECCVVSEEVERNVKATLATDYAPLTPLLSETGIGSCSIVGSGPSLHGSWPHMKGDVFACNAAHDFLIGKGVKPKYAMLWDAHPVVATMFAPTRDVTYLVASRCHRDVFGKLEGHDVRVWHAQADEEPTRGLLEAMGRMEPLVLGGSAAVTRCMYLATAMGYRELHLFGVDGSFDKGETHVRKSAVEEKPMRVYLDGEWFDTTAWLCGQAEDFKLIGPILRNLGVELIVHGTGLIPKIARNLGFPVIDHQEEK